MDLYEQYNKLEKEIEGLESKKELLRADIEKELPAEGVKNNFVTAFWTLKKKFKYSPKVDGLTAELKATKAKEEEDGTATFEETRQLTIKVK